jgi:putative tryptophan/tyrosine transport system substrate-binding protein
VSAGLSLLAGCGAVPPLLRPEPKVPRLGWLIFGSPPYGSSFEATVLRGLERLGYVAGRNLVIDARYAEGRPDRLPTLAAELVATTPDLILAIGTDVAQAVQRATQAVPIVMGSSLDPVRAGLTASLARPGGNVTGVSYLVDRLNPKRLEVLKLVVPGAARVAVLWNPNHPDGEFQELEEAGRTQGLSVESVQVPTSAALDGALAAVAGDRPDAVVVVPSRSMTFVFGQIGEFAARQRLPVVAGWREFAESGALLTYGPDRFEAIEHCAAQVDKILKGVKPAELPIVQPTKFDLVLNLKTAQTLGLAIPPSVLQQATEIMH